MWYFDSWAVLDGQAFVSHRSADSLDAKATVFLSVPDLEPVPIGRISTALRAQRSCFQDGFRSADTGEEFEFADLEQVRELIRRAYLGGGLAPVPTPIEGPPPRRFRGEARYWPPPKPSPIQDGGAYYEEAVSNLVLPSPLFDDLSGLSDRSNRRGFLEMLHHSAADLEPYLRAFAEATLLELARVNAEVMHLPPARDTFVSWMQMLRSLGHWEIKQDFLKTLGLTGIESEIRFDWHRMQYLSLLDKSLLFRIPCPLRRTWSGYIQSLGHMLLLPLVDRTYFEANYGLAEIIPALFCAMVVVQSRELFVSRVPTLVGIDRYRLVGRACEWLEGELPKVELSREVESELTSFAWRRLGLNPNRLRRNRLEEDEGGPRTAY